MFSVLLHTDIQKQVETVPKIQLLLAFTPEKRQTGVGTLRSSDSCDLGEVIEILCASVALSGTWANHLASDPPPRRVASINELMMFGEHVSFG